MSDGALFRTASVQRDTLFSMSDTRTLVVAIVGTGLAVITVHVAVMSMLIGGVSARIDDLRADIVQFHGEVREDIADMLERLRAVEIGFARIEQRLETLERAILPPAEAAGQE